MLDDVGLLLTVAHLVVSRDELLHCCEKQSAEEIHVQAVDEAV